MSETHITPLIPYFEDTFIFGMDHSIARIDGHGDAVICDDLQVFKSKGYNSTKGFPDDDSDAASGH